MGDLGLLARSLQDKIVTPQRAKLQYRFYDVYDAAMSSGVMACGISGSGPAIFAMSDNEIIAEKAVEAMGKIYTSDKVEYSSWISPVNNEGTVKC